MAHLERLGQLRPLVAPARLTPRPPLRPAAGAMAALGMVLVVALALTGCIDDDAETATFGPGDQVTTLPPITRSDPGAASTDPAEGDDHSPGGAEDGGDDTNPTAATPAPTTASTAPPPPLQGLSAETIADGFDQPILVASAPGTEALFVVEREGVIKLVDAGVVAEEPFLDLTDQLNSNSIEQGLLGLAFHPGYADNGRLFAYWTGPEGDSVLAEFTASTPTSLDPASMTVILEVDQPAERHNAGHLAFGPDGLLYLSLGDGGSGGAPAQDTANLLGAIVRLDVDTPGGYSIPDTNPFGDEIWAYGLRNPWRFSIDAETNLLYVGDVGQESVEEVNVVSLDDGAGTNFGWFEMEGDDCFRSGCDPTDMTGPTFQYSHAEGCSITGGHVYRGAAIPEFVGHYFFADWCKGFVRSFRLDGDVVRDQFDWTDDLQPGQVTSFGLDPDGELLAVNWEGRLFRIVPIR